MTDTYIDTVADPWETLGVSKSADEQEIREAYLQCVKAHPPSRDPEGAERIREAFELLRDPLRRAERSVLYADPDAPLSSVIRGHKGHRAFVGPRPWLRVLSDD